MNKRGDIELKDFGAILIIYILLATTIASSTNISISDNSSLPSASKETEKILDSVTNTTEKTKESEENSTIQKTPNNYTNNKTPTSENKSNQTKPETTKQNKTATINQSQIINKSNQQIPQESIKTINESVLIELIQEPAKVGEKVRWKKRAYTNNTSYKIKIPKGAKEIPKPQIFSISEAKKYLEIEYETAAPEKKEKQTTTGKEILIYSEEHYKNVTAFTSINESLKITSPESIKIQWLEENKEIPVTKIEDQNNNGIYDYIEWTVPHLSNQTFKIIIITKASHLNQDKTLISDIYEEVKSLDSILSETVSNQEFVRITFEYKLDNTRDITLYPKIITGNPKIEVYEKNQSTKIAEFNNLIEGKNTIYLEDLTGEQDTFDLKIINGSIQFDYITDPDLDLEDFEAYSTGETTFTQNWTNTGTGDDCSWHANIGSTASTGTGPSADHTTGSGVYAYVETSTSPPTGISDSCGATGYEAYLLSENLDASTYNITLDFWYNMLGANMGTLYLDVYNGTWQNDVWSDTQNVDTWFNQQINLGNYEGTIQLRVRGTRGASWDSDMAIDDLNISATLKNQLPTIPTSLTCDGMNCDNVAVNKNLILNCSGSADADADEITYFINSTLGFIGNHTETTTLTWNTTLLSETSKINFTCNAIDISGSGKSSPNYFTQTALIIDHTAPKIDFVSPTQNSGTSINSGSITLNTTVNETNFKNITFNLYDSAHQQLESDTFTDSTREKTWTSLGDATYFYNVTTYDKAGIKNSTETRSIMLDRINPSGSSSSPSSGTHSKNTTQNLTVSATDSNGISEVILSIFNESDFLINTTSVLITGTSITVGVIYTFLIDGIYKWFYKVIDLAGNTDYTENKTIIIDTTSSIITLESIINNSGDTDGSLKFDYNITDELSTILNCSLILNRNNIETDTIVQKGTIQYFTKIGLSPARYNWSIQCYDEANNLATSELRYFDVVSMNSFSGDTTNVSTIDMSNTNSFTLENPSYGKITYNETLDITGGLNFDSLVTISSGLIQVDTVTQPKLNASATLDFYNLNYEFTPTLFKDNQLCTDCTFNSYLSGNLSYNVTSFSKYEARENSELLIWDETESTIKYENEQVKFFANYTNITSKESINGTGVSCNITFEDSQSQMTFNSSTLLYDYNRTLSPYGIHNYNITCLGLTQGYENITAQNSAAIQFSSSGVGTNGKIGYTAQSGVYTFSGLDEFIPLDFPVDIDHAFVIAPNQMNQEDTAPGTTGDPATNDDDSFVTLYLYNSTHIRAQRTSSDDGAMKVTWQVLEAKDSEFTVQRGSHSYSDSTTSTVATIPNAVTPANTMSWFYINTTYTGRNGDKIQFYSDITNSTAITFTREHSGTSTDIDFRWVVAEWNTSKINNFVKGYTGSITGPNTAPDCFDIGTTINKSTSMLFHQVHAINDNDGGLDSSARAGYIQDDTTVCFYDYDGGFTAGVKWFVIDFKNATKREENIHTDWASTDYSDSITFTNSYSTNKTISFVSGTCNGDGTAKPRHTQWSTLTGGTTSTGLDIDRTYGGQAREYAWQVLELPYFNNPDSPTFANYSVNKTYAKQNEQVRFSLNVTDIIDGVNWVKGIVNGVERNFTKGTGAQWYYDYTCTGDEIASFTYVSAEDNGYPPTSNSTSVNATQIICDSTNPIVSFITPNTPINAYNSSRNYFEIDTSITETNFEKISYNLYNSTGLVNQSNFSTASTTTMFSNLETGVYIYNVTVYDKAGNSGSSNSRTIIFDNTAPQIEFTSPTKIDGTITQGTSVSINTTITEPNFKNVTFSIYDEFGYQERIPSTYTYPRTELQWDLLGDGSYFYNVTVSDSFGNTNKTETREITLDNTLPIIEYTTGTLQNNAYTSRNYIFINTQVTESNFQNITFSLYNATSLINKTNFSDSTRALTWNSLSDGVYYYNVTVYDKAQNENTSSTRKITIDSTDPIIDFGSGTESSATKFPRDYIYIDTTLTETNFKNITFDLYDESALISSTTFSDSTRDINLTSLESKTYYYNVTVYDLAENYASTSTRSIGLDLEGPTINIINPKSTAYGVSTNLALDYTVLDEIAGADSCWWNIDNGANNSIVCGTNTTFDSSNGQRTLNFFSNDTFGNVGEDSVTFLISTGGPAISLVSPEDKTIYQSATDVLFNYSATDVQGVSSCSLYGTWNGGWHLNQTDFDWDFGVAGSISEDFESVSWDNWTQVSDGTGCDWTRGITTPSGSTGPTGGYGPSPSGSSNFLFTEATTGQNCEFNAGNHWTSIESDFYDADKYNLTISFWYHMYGAAMGSLHLDINDSTGWHNDTWTLSGQQQSTEGADWKKATVNIGAYSGQIKVRLRGVVGTAYTSDISIDEAIVSQEPRVTKDYGNFTVNLATESNYEWNIKCNDTLGQDETAIYNYTVGLDLTAPIVDFDPITKLDTEQTGLSYIYIGANLTETNPKNITFNLYKNGASVGSATYSDNTLNHTFSSLTDGTYYYNITAYDKSGRFGNSLTRSITLDTVDPTGTLLSPPNGYFTSNKTQNFTADVSDTLELLKATLYIFNSTGQIIYNYAINLVGLTTAVIGILYTLPYDDTFTWFYGVTDSVNNTYNTTSRIIEIDSTSPVITFLSPTPANNAILLQDFIPLNTSIYEQNFKNITFQIYNGEGIYPPSPNTYSDSTRFINYTILPDDTYYCNISSFDKAGNEGSSSTRTITLDTTSPVLIFSGATQENNAVISGSQITVEVNVTEVNEQNITFRLYNSSGYQKRINTFSDGRRSITWTLLPGGTYYYNVTVIDRVSLSSSTSTRTITLDNIAPTIDFVSPTESNNANKSQTFISINTSVTEDNFQNITFNLYNSTSQVDSQTLTSAIYYYNFTSLPEGIYYYNVTVIDKAFQNSSTSTRTITLDTTLPILTFIVPTEPTGTIKNKNWVFLNSTLIETNFKQIIFRLYDSSGLKEEYTFADTTRSYNFTSLGDENYAYNITVIDYAGNQNSTETRTIGLDSAPPVVTITKPKSKTYGYNESIPLEHTAIDQVSALDSCWWNIDSGANQSITCNSPTTFNTTVASHTIQLFANDTFGNVGSDSVTFFISITGPAIELIYPINDTFYGSVELINFSFISSDPDGVDTCSLYGDWNGGWKKNETYSGNWYDVGFKSRKDITITNTGSSTLTDFPYYLNISSKHTETGDYSDLRFLSGTCDSSGSAIYYEIEDYDTASANVWIKIPSFTSGSNNICMYYANQEAENSEDASLVWNSSYTSVYHLDHTSGTALDSLGNWDAEDGIEPDSNMNQVGKIGGADYLDGSDYLGTNTEWDVDGAHTYCTWVKFSSGHDGVILEDGGQTDGTGLGVTSSGELRYAECYNNVFNPMDSGGNYADNTWHYLCGGHQGAGKDQFLYVDGALISSITQGDGNAGTGNARIGQSVSGNPVHDTTAANPFTGYLDEIRVSSIDRSADWINQSYRNIIDYDTNVILGIQQNFAAFSISIQEEGIYSWNVECNDTIGYSSFALENYSFVVDVTAPQVLFGSGTKANNSVVGENWIYTDVNIIENNFKNITFNLYNSSGLVDSDSFSDSTREINWTNILPGTYFYNVTVYDRANHSGYSETRTITIDTTAPNGSLNIPLDNAFVNDLNQNLTATFSDANGILNATLFIYNQTGSLIYTSYVELAGALTATFGIVYEFLTQGVYYWFYRVEDTVGNTFDTSNNTLNIDTTIPLIDFSTGTKNSGAILIQENVYANTTTSETNFANITFYLYDGEGLETSNTFTDSTREINWTLLTDDTYFYNVTIRDIAGNTNSTTTRSITLDNTAPTIDFTTETTPDGGFISGDTISVFVTATEANEENITFDLYNATGYKTESNTFTDKTRHISWNLLPNGIYYYNVTIIDKVGLSSSTLTRSLMVDNTNPEIIYMFPTEINGAHKNQTWINFKVKITEDNFYNVSFSLYNTTGLISTHSFLDTTREYNWTNLPDGEYYYNATTYDKSSNKNSTTTRTITLDTIAPQIEFGVGVENDATLFKRDWIFLKALVTETNEANITFSISGDNGYLNTTTFTDKTHQLYFTDLASGNYQYNITIFDIAGNTNKTETRTISLDKTGPSIQIISPKAKAYGYNESLALTYIVTDPIAGADTCWYNLDNTANITTSCIGSTTFDTSDGQHTLHFFANDTLNNLGYKNVTFLVSTTGPAIQLITPEDNSFYSQATELFFNYTAEDPDLTESCSLWGTWNGGWHLNQTDYDWITSYSRNLTEDFENYATGDTVFYENWTNVIGDDCSWHADNAGTASVTTGPNIDHTLGTTSGIYAYLETSTSPPTGISDTCGTTGYEAYLESSDLDADTNSYNVSFWYHMYGASMGSLNLDVYNGTWQNSVWSISGQQQTSETDPYTQVNIDLENYTGIIRLRIRGVRGTDYTGDIAIDDLKILYENSYNKPSGNFTVNLSEEGTSEWNVLCNDTIGYVTSAVSNYSVTFDVTNPQVDFGTNTLANNSNISQNYIFINSSIIETNFKNITFYLYNQISLLDTQFFNDTTRDYTFTNLDDGRYYYNFTVYDSANRMNSTLTRTILLDTLSPTGSLQSPPDNSYTNNATQNLTVALSDENGLAEAILYIYNATGLVYSVIIPLAGQLSTTIGTIYEFLTDGIYDWFYQTEDLVGNKYNTTNYTLTVDTIPPQINFIPTTSPNNTYITHDYIYFNISLTETNFKNITFDIYNGEGIYDTYTSTTSKRDINYTYLPDDEYSYNVMSSDLAGNTNASETRTITLDNTAPLVSYIYPTEITTANKSQNYIFINTSITETNFANITFRLYLSGTKINTTIYQTQTPYINFTNLANGDYSYNATVTDMAGLSSSLSTRTITLDTIPPILFFIAPTEDSGTELEQEHINLNTFLSESNFKNITFYLYNETTLLNETIFNTPITQINFTASGTNITYFYNATTFDTAGNKDSTSTRNITLIDTTPPTLTLTSPENKTYPYNTSIRVSYETYDLHQDTCWYSLNFGPNITMPNCQGITIDVADEQQHTITVFANDTMGYTASDNITFFANSSLIKIPSTYYVLTGSVFTDGNSVESITETHPTKGFILHTVRGSDSSPATLQVTSDFTDPEQIEFNNYNSGSGVIVDYSLIAGPGITVQRGEISYTTQSSILLTINQVNLSNTFIVVNNRLNSTDSSENVDGFWTGKFTDDSNINFTRGSNSANGVLSYQIVSWEGSTVQSANSIISDTSSSTSEPISTNPNSSFMLFSRKITGSTNLENSMIRGAVKNPNFLEFNRTGSTGEVAIESFTIENELFESQHGNHTHLIASSPQYAKIPKTLVNTSRAFDTHSNDNIGATTSFATAALTQNIYNKTAIVLQKGVATGAGETSWSAIEITEADSPEITLEYPEDNANISSLTINHFNFSTSDESEILNCSLYANWSGSWQLNQTIYNPTRDIDLNFSAITVNPEGYYSWNVKCTDAYKNTGWASQNFTFAAFLPPTKPTIYSITQSSNDGTGNVTLLWNTSNYSTVYKIYAGVTIPTMSYLAETTNKNYTDSIFAGEKRRFYQVKAINPVGENSSDIFSAHLYELKHNGIKSRNWIAFPSNFSYLTNANETLNDITNAVAFTTFNSTIQTRVTCNNFSCPEDLSCTSTNCNFKIKQGKGYEVDIDISGPQEINWSAVGKVYEAKTLDLTKNATSFGKNWIALYANTVIPNAQSLIGDISNADAVSIWISINQTSDGLFPSPFPWIPGFIGNNFQLNLEEGYEVSVTESGTWTQH